ncbi:hypothetical protein [Cyanobacterium sp. uoEpiScrs1]|uniref:hypothetical protein n=1 Tax=Cyanobacterium sp. uoEpiScrs1 TaxID=2976343 RepID=UPI002269E6E9|nr:hypothetical protein [Cyanobacterium sp. uoEpiScrs1]
MLKLVWHSTQLFFKGRLIRNSQYVYKQMVSAFFIGSLLFIGLSKMEISLAFTIMVSSLLTGMLMPFLLKDIKMQ